MRMTMRSFSKIDYINVKSGVLGQVKSQINEIDNSYIQKASVAELEAHYVEMHRIEPLSVSIEDVHLTEPKPIKMYVDDPMALRLGRRNPVEVSGMLMKLVLPYEGDRRLWEVRPSTYYMSGYPDITVCSDRIEIDIQARDTDVNTQKLQREIDDYLQSIETACTTLKKDVEELNQELERVVSESLKHKKEVADKALGGH